MPLLSVIVPVYNTEKYLSRCIRSILAQSYRDFEVILVDDGSTDGSYCICDSFKTEDTRIRVIHTANQGVMSARKTGVAAACGEYISFVDSDDWIEAEYYNENIMRIMEKRADMLMTGYLLEGIQDKEVPTGLRNGVYRKKEIRDLLRKGGIIPSMCLKIFKRQQLTENIKLIDNRVSRGEDMLCTYACLLDMDTVCVYNSCRYHYVQHDASAMHQYGQKNIENLYYFSNNIRRIRRKKNADFMDCQWNQLVRNELMDIIIDEFKGRNLILNRTDSEYLKQKFSLIQMPLIMVDSASAMKMRESGNSEKIIFYLYSAQLFELLNLYLKFAEKVRE